MAADDEVGEEGREGLTGEAVEYLRPVTSENAVEHRAFKQFEGLDEERYPVFLAVPIRGKAGPLGALVVLSAGPASHRSQAPRRPLVTAVLRLM